MTIGNSSTKVLARKLATGWHDFLAATQRRVLADEVQELLDAVIERERNGHRLADKEGR